MEARMGTLGTLAGRGEGGAAGLVVLDRNPLYDIPGDRSVSSVVEPRRSRIGVAEKLLHVFKRDALLQQVGSGRCSEGMAGED